MNNWNDRLRARQNKDETHTYEIQRRWSQLNVSLWPSFIQLSRHRLLAKVVSSILKEWLSSANFTHTLQLESYGDFIIWTYLFNEIDDMFGNEINVNQHTISQSPSIIFCVSMNVVHICTCIYFISIFSSFAKFYSLDTKDFAWQIECFCVHLSHSLLYFFFVRMCDGVSNPPNNKHKKIS